MQEKIMLSEDINNITYAVYAIERGDKETAAAYIQRVKTSTRSRHARRLVYALIHLHNLRPYIEQAIKEQREWREHLAQETQS
jgi:hypothetical protein